MGIVLDTRHLLYNAASGHLVHSGHLVMGRYALISSSNRWYVRGSSDVSMAAAKTMLNGASWTAIGDSGYGAYALLSKNFRSPYYRCEATSVRFDLEGRGPLVRKIKFLVDNSGDLTGYGWRVGWKFSNDTAPSGTGSSWLASTGEITGTAEGEQEFSVTGASYSYIYLQWQPDPYSNPSVNGAWQTEQGFYDASVSPWLKVIL